MGALGRCKEEDKCQVKFVPSWVGISQVFKCSRGNVNEGDQG